jgi:replication-associated recombination protein RarA
MMLHEKYRPKEWADLVGQDKAVAIARRIIERPGFDRGAFFIDCAGNNNSGTGKSSLAWVIATTLADPFFITELPGAKMDKAAVVEIERSAHLCSWSADKPFRVWIVNEAHAVTQGAVDLLLTFLEALPRHCVVIFTTTRQPDEELFGTDNGPLYSRCHCIRLTNQGIAEPFAQRVKSIAVAEGLDGQPMAKYVALIRQCKNNMRRALQLIEAGELA